MPQYDPQALQQKYERWRELHRQQEQAQAQWLEAEALLHELQAYYQSLQWREDHANNVPIECNNGEYCILSEDTLWNMLTDRDEVAKRWMRLGLDAFDRN
ncbi:DUF4298 domain-containing protein [Novilysobacter antarcticus]|uniref:DUF4298 domain-containing protein n=1 Tax=Novilysobacter antarcticus TaxID=2862543 RepID=UPI001C9979BF|nr:DUF4298 domain-containing protein [Lysobacter antarcticus]